MAVRHNSISVGTSATALHYQEPASADRGQEVLLTNAGSASVYVGGPGVTTTSYGYELKAGTSLAVEIADGESLFGVVATGTVTVRALYVGA